MKQNDESRFTIYKPIRKKLVSFFLISIIVGCVFSLVGIPLLIDKLDEIEFLFSSELSLMFESNTYTISESIHILFNTLFIIYLIVFYCLMYHWERRGYFVDKEETLKNVLSHSKTANQNNVYTH